MRRKVEDEGWEWKRSIIDGMRDGMESEIGMKDGMRWEKKMESWTGMEWEMGKELEMEECKDCIEAQCNAGVSWIIILFWTNTYNIFL